MFRAILTGGVLFVGLSIGWQLRATWALLGEARAQAQAAQVVERQAEVTAQVDAQHAVDAAAARTVYRTLYREIPTHVPPEAVERCTVPVGFVRLHDAAAQGVPAVSDPAGEPDAAPSRVGLDRVAEAIVDNYGSCQAVRAQLSALQQWVKVQAGLY